MERLFLHILNTSIVAMWLVLAIILIRLCLKKLPKRLMMVMWLLVALRLIFPFSIESMFSLVPSRHTIPVQVLTDGVPRIKSGFSGFNTAVNPLLESRAKIEIAESMVKVMPAVRLTTIVSILWIIGLVTMLILALVSYFRLRRQVRDAIRVEGNIFASEHVASPFILGVVRPRIYLPLHLTNEEKKYVIAHERSHIKRKDHWIKPFAYILLSIFWFNPLLWVAYILLNKDIEMACDERVVKELSSSEKARYSNILLSLSVNHRGVQACPLAFGQGDVKRRVVNILNYKKPAFWIIVAVLVVAIAVGVLFLTDPIRKQEEPNKSTSKLIDHSNSQTKTGSQDVFDSLLKQYPIISGLNGTYFTGELIGRLEMVSSWPRLGDESLAINSGELQIFNKDEELRSTGALVSAKKLPITQLRTYLDQHGLPMSLKIDLPAGDPNVQPKKWT